MQGLYGPFTMTERVLQKIWLQQDFSTAQLRLRDGRPLEILFPGHWNLLAGPDFKAARFRIEGREVEGDVEVHFHESDWSVHQHGANPAYCGVVLHVLLFPPGETVRAQRRADGSEIPALVLLPLLHRDLEEYVTDDALEVLTARDQWRRLEGLVALPTAAVRDELRLRARQRWERKVGHARQRLARLGWEGALHCTALEVLGYRQNRVPMLAVAERWPLPQWSDPTLPFAALQSVSGWIRQGVRPANQPVRRLEQYSHWNVHNPIWTARLQEWGSGACGLSRLADEPTGPARARGGFDDLRHAASELCSGAVSTPRLDTLVCDGFLPLLAARRAHHGYYALWFHWFPGDMPDQIRRSLRRLGMTGTRDQPLCHGFAQGMFDWLIERDSFRVSA